MFSFPIFHVFLVVIILTLWVCGIKTSFSQTIKGNSGISTLYLWAVSWGIFSDGAKILMDIFYGLFCFTSTILVTLWIRNDAENSYCLGVKPVPSLFSHVNFHRVNVLLHTDREWQQKMPSWIWCKRAAGKPIMCSSNVR